MGAAGLAGFATGLAAAFFFVGARAALTFDTASASSVAICESALTRSLASTVRRSLEETFRLLASSKTRMAV